MYDPDTVNFVNQQVPRDLAAIMKRQKQPPLTKPEIANDPTHAHSAKAASQLADESSVWTMVAFFLNMKAHAQGYTEFPKMQHDDFELMSVQTAGKI